MKRLIAWGRSAIGIAFLAFPTAFRRAHRSDALTYFEERARDRARRSGMAGVLILVVRDMTSTVLAGLAERASRARDALPSLRTVPVDMRFGLRSLTRHPSFVISAIVPIALGVAGVAAVFAVIDGVLLRPLPYPSPEQLVKVGRPLANGILAPVSTANVIDLEGTIDAFESLAGVTGGQTTVVDATEAELLSLTRPTKQFMATFRLEPVIGRGFVDEDFYSPAVTILTWDLWQRRWHGDPDAIGRTVSTEVGTLEIIGVLPRAWTSPEAVRGADGDLWVPLDYADPRLEITRAFGFTAAVARLRPGTSLETADEQLRSRASALAEAYPKANHEKDGTPKLLAARTLHAETVGGAGRALTLLFLAVAILMMIACANVANLFLAHGSRRARELAIRTVMGAGRSRLVVQLLAESIAVSLAGGVLGLILAKASVKTLVSLAPELPRAASVTVDLPVVGAAVALSLVCGVAFGALPALLSSNREPGGALRGGAERARGPEATRTALVVGQTALAVALVTGGALLTNSAVRLSLVEPGFDLDEVLAFRPHLRYLGEERSPVPFYRELIERLEGLPGVSSVSASMFTPGETLPIIVSVQGTEGAEPVQRWQHSVMPGFFRTVGIPILEGHDLNWREGPEDPRVAIVSRSFADEQWPAQAAVGRTFTIRSGRKETTFTVVRRRRGHPQQRPPIIHGACLLRVVPPEPVASLPRNARETRGRRRRDRTRGAVRSAVHRPHDSIGRCLVSFGDVRRAQRGGAILRAPARALFQRRLGDRGSGRIRHDGLFRGPPAARDGCAEGGRRERRRDRRAHLTSWPGTGRSRRAPGALVGGLRLAGARRAPLRDFAPGPTYVRRSGRCAARCCGRGLCSAGREGRPRGPGGHPAMGMRRR